MEIKYHANAAQVSNVCSFITSETHGRSGCVDRSAHSATEQIIYVL
jgi:hypothetical protein